MRLGKGAGSWGAFKMSLGTWMFSEASHCRIRETKEWPRVQKDHSGCSLEKGLRVREAEINNEGNIKNACH